MMKTRTLCFVQVFLGFAEQLTPPKAGIIIIIIIINVFIADGLAVEIS